MFCGVCFLTQVQKQHRQWFALLGSWLSPFDSIPQLPVRNCVSTYYRLCAVQNWHSLHLLVGSFSGWLCPCSSFLGFWRRGGRDKKSIPPPPLALFQCIEQCLQLLPVCVIFILFCMFSVIKEPSCVSASLYQSLCLWFSNCHKIIFTKHSKILVSGHNYATVHMW